MNNVLCLAPFARPPTDPGLRLYPEQFLADLLALHEEMIEQLHSELLEAAGTADLITGIIDQHQQTASMLRARLESQEHEAGPPTNF